MMLPVGCVVLTDDECCSRYVEKVSFFREDSVPYLQRLEYNSLIAECLEDTVRIFFSFLA